MHAKIEPSISCVDKMADALSDFGFVRSEWTADADSANCFDASASSSDALLAFSFGTEVNLTDARNVCYRKYRGCAHRR